MKRRDSSFELLLNIVEVVTRVRLCYASALHDLALFQYPTICCDHDEIHFTTFYLIIGLSDIISRKNNA